VHVCSASSEMTGAGSSERGCVERFYGTARHRQTEQAGGQEGRKRGRQRRE
jgi:hypothetical protein